MMTLGVLLRSPNHLSLREKASENWRVDFACQATPHTYVTMDQKTSHKGTFFKIEIYTSES